MIFGWDEEEKTATDIRFEAVEAYADGEHPMHNQVARDERANTVEIVAVNVEEE